LKTASWFLTLPLAGLLVYAFGQVSSTSESSSALSSHLTLQYLQHSEAETAIHSPVEAVLADYRSFDLLAVAVLFSTAALVVLFFFHHPPSFGILFAAYLWLGLGALMVLGLGFLSLKTGSNFLDYEALAAWAPPARARWDGALILLAGTLLSLGGLLAIVIRWVQTPEGDRGR
jgi:hypothetical protein